jgi:hypothetical protein
VNIKAMLRWLAGYKMPNKRDSPERYRMSEATKRMIEATDRACHDLQDDRWFKSFPERHHRNNGSPNSSRNSHG